MQPQIYVPPLSKFNKTLIIGIVSIFLINSVLKLNGLSLIPWMGLSWRGLSAGLFYLPLTFSFIETSFLSVLFNSLLIWFIGSELEQKWGSRFYWRYLGLCVGVSAIIYVIAGAWGFGSGVLHGMSGVTYALLVAYGMIYKDRILTFMLIFPMRAKYFCMLLAGIQLYMSIFSGHGLLALVHLMAMLTGFIYLQLLSMRARGQEVKFWPERKKRNDAKRKFYIVSDEEKQQANPKDPKFWQ